MGKNTGNNLLMDKKVTLDSRVPYDIYNIEEKMKGKTTSRYKRKNVRND